MKLLTEIKEDKIKIVNFSELNELVDKAIDEVPLRLVVETDSDLRVVKEARTKIRKAQEVIKTFRKEVEKEYLGEFIEECKSVESRLNNCDLELKGKVDSYNAVVKGEDVEPEYEVKCKLDTKQYKSFENWAKKNSVAYKATLKGDK